MIRHMLLILLTYAGLVLDAGSTQWSLPAGTAPCFLLLVAALGLLLIDGTAAVLWAAVIGMLCDAISRGPMGLNVVLLANLVFFSQAFGVQTMRHSAATSAAVVWVFVTIAALASNVLSSLLQSASIDLAYLSQYAAGRAGGSVAAFLAVVLPGKLLTRSIRYVLPSAKVGADQRGWAA